MLLSPSSKAVARSALKSIKPFTTFTSLNRHAHTMSSASIDQTHVSIGPVQASMQAKLAVHFPSLTHLEVINESHKHNVPKGSESHFKVVIVSDLFDGKAIIERHRMVNSALSEELKDSIHALSIQAKTSTQWAKDPSLTTTPNCQGGSKK